MYMVCICLNSCSVDAILLFSLTFLERKQTNEKPSLVRSPEILRRANLAGVQHAWVNKPIKAEYSNF